EKISMDLLAITCRRSVCRRAKCV
ncbi:Trans-aconitate 2-methyltransferase, partial [Haemophilus influenzae]